jgi:C4-dicarboxylate transporter DctM subunit
MTGPVWMAIAFVGTLAIGVPIPFAAGVATLIGLLIIDIPLALLAQSAYNAFEPFPLTTIPLFTLAGVLMERGGMSKDLIEISRKLFGTLKGGLSLVTVAGCMFFAALSGSSPATTAAIGSLTIPGMLKEGYKPSFAAAVSASSGALGSMIPPSNLFIIYALVADESIPRLFLAGVVPGLLIGFFLLLTSYIIARRNNYGLAGEAFSLNLLLKAMWQGKWALGVPILILGGIYTGIFTPSEAAAVAVFYGLFTGVFIYKKLNFRMVYESCRFTSIIIGTVLFILSAAKAFGQLVTLYDIPESVNQLVRVVSSVPMACSAAHRRFLHDHRHVG